MSDKARGLLTPDYSDIKIVPDSARAAWFRHARPSYWCIRCGVFHRTWSKVGERHDPQKAAR